MNTHTLLLRTVAVMSLFCCHFTASGQININDTSLGFRQMMNMVYSDNSVTGDTAEGGKLAGARAVDMMWSGRAEKTGSTSLNMFNSYLKALNTAIQAKYVAAATEIRSRVFTVQQSRQLVNFI